MRQKSLNTVNLGFEFRPALIQFVNLPLSFPLKVFRIHFKLLLYRGNFMLHIHLTGIIFLLQYIKFMKLVFDRVLLCFFWMPTIQFF